MVDNEDYDGNIFYNKRILRILKQTGKRVSLTRDRGRKASLPGKRISSSGSSYWETRKNRSDNLGKNI